MAVCKQKGFTLLEILLVLMLMALIAAIAVPILGRSVEGVGVRAEALRLAGEIRYTQQKAIGEGQNFCIAFYQASNTYRVYPQGDTDDVRKEGELGDTVESFSTNFTGDVITYMPTGAPYITGTEGQIALTSDGGRSVNIIVAMGTGRVRVE